MTAADKHGFRRLRLLVVAVLLFPMLSACAANINADPAIQFGPDSRTAIVVLGTSANPDQIYSWSGRSLSTFWQAYDPATQRLIPNGSTFRTKVLSGTFSSTDYRQPTVTVLEIRPGSYALTGAGFPHLMTLYVPAKDGNRQADTYIVDPRRHVDPRASVSPRRNFLFSAEPGQILYLGHFEFLRARYRDRLVSIDYTQDEPDAREALKDFEGLKGEMLMLNLEEPTETASR